MLTGTLDFADASVVSIPSGTTTAAMSAARQAATAAEQRVSTDESALSIAESTARSNLSLAHRQLGAERATTRAARAQNAASIAQDVMQLRVASAKLTSDQSALRTDRSELAADESLGCPAAPTSGDTSSPTPASGGPASTEPASTTATAATPPSAITGSASTISPTTATLSGSINPNGNSTVYSFEYGRTDSYALSTAATPAGSGTDAVLVAVSISGLDPESTYVFRLVATNAAGTVDGAGQPFSTPQTACAAKRQEVGVAVHLDQADEWAIRVARANLKAAKASARSPASSAAAAPAATSTDTASIAQARAQLASDRIARRYAQQALAIASASAANPAATITSVASAGRVLVRGETAYALDGEAVPLFYGTVTPWRALFLGVRDGPDVAELQANLVHLGFGASVSSGDHFSSATRAAVMAWQRSIGTTPTGIVGLGDVIVEPGPVRVTTADASRGETVQPGLQILHVSSTARVVDVPLPVESEYLVKKGDSVTITLPDGATTTPGVVSDIAPVGSGSGSTTAPAASTGGPSSSSNGATANMLVRLRDPAAARRYDQAPVEVAIISRQVRGVLAISVTALVGEPGGSYDLDVIARHTHRLVPVRVGMFDEDSGLVQVSGSTLRPGQRVVVARQ